MGILYFIMAIVIPSAGYDNATFNMMDHLEYSQRVAKIKFNELLYVQWIDEGIQSFWLELDFCNWICVYLQDIQTGSSAILQYVLRGGHYCGRFDNWIDNYRKPWWKITQQPIDAFCKEFQLLAVTKEERNNIDAALFQLSIKVMDMYVKFDKEISIIQNIDWHTIEHGPAHQYKKVSHLSLLVHFC